MPVTTKGFYSFLPYVRQGLALKLTNPDTYLTLTSPSGARGHFQLSLSVQKTTVDGTTPAPVNVNNTVVLNGPGDVIGINSSAIVKVSPADGVTNFEPNYLPYIEFYDEDFPWRYTPAAVKRELTTGFKYRIRPWVTLIVLKEDEFTNLVPFNGILPAITIIDPPSVLPSQTQLWAWAHVHVNDNLSANGDSAIGTNPTQIQNAVDRLETLLAKNPDKAFSRIISPRRLEPNTGYHAFLIPTFEGGRRAGLGITGNVNMLIPAWKPDTPANTQFPVYKQWYFKTGGAGDFESLVRLLQPRILYNSVGKRQADLQRSNNPELEAVPPPVPTLGVQGVIQPTSATEDQWMLNNAYSEKIRNIINAPAEIIGQVGGDPVIAPPIYGCWHAAENQVTAPGSGAGNWIQKANLDPRYRVFAGAGAEVLRRNQDAYMAIAWEQVGEVIKANKVIRLMQLAKQANTALYEKHLKSLNNELLLNISAPVHGRIIGTVSTKTVFKNVSESAIPNSMLSAAFRRITRPGGPLVSSISFTTSTPISTAQLIADVNNGVVQPTQPVPVPVGQISYTIWPQSQLTPSFTNSLSQNIGFVISNPGAYVGTPTPGPNPPLTQLFVNTVADLHALITSLPGYSFSTNPGLNLLSTGDIILDRTDPVSNSIELVRRSVKLQAVNNSTPVLPDLNQVLAAPKIRTAMFRDLAALSPDWIMPGLNNVGNNTISILQTNQKYVEAFMLGLNHAMAGELLWRGYPTDQRGTTFSYFWGYNNSMSAVQTVIGNDAIADLNAYRDIEDIHRWRVVQTDPTSNLTALGTNSARTGMSDPEMLVLIIRGELLRKYPGSVIYMQKAQWNTVGGVPDTTQPRKIATNSTPLFPAFTGNVGQDIYMLGFSGVTAEDVRGGGLIDTSQPGYFVIFQEKAGELKFGADVYDPSAQPPTTLATWDDVNWGNIVTDPDEFGFIDTTKTFTVTANPDTVTWNMNAATIAYALHQSPVKLNVHAEGLIPTP